MNYRNLEKEFFETRKQQMDIFGRELTEMDIKVSQVMFESVLKAVENVRSGNRRACMQAVSLSTGLGKSTSAYALIATLIQQDPTFTVAYVVPTAKMAEEAQKGIEELLGKYTTFLWTSYHKHKGVDRKRAAAELGSVPERTANKADLPLWRVVIVTHSQLLHELKTGRDEGTLSYHGKPRSVVFIDEHPELVEVVETTAERLQAFHDHLVKYCPQHHWLPVISQVVAKMSEISRSPRQQYLSAELLAPEQGKVFDKDEGLNLWDLTDDDVSLDSRLRELQSMSDIVTFLRAASKGNTFYSRDDFAFFAYQLYFPTDYPGFVLLDATSDLMGLVALHPGVEFVEVPQVNYENLDLYHISMPKKFRHIREVIKVRRTGREYADFIIQTVLANSSPGDEVLVVVHKDMLTQELLQASENPDAPLDWQGRKVNTQNWGAGVGLNKFKHKTHVFLFGDYVLPRSGIISRTHGWSQKPLNENNLRLAEGRRWRGDLYTPRGAYKEPHEGHLLRWTKQLAMRGSARQVDADGKCFPMTLFTTMDVCRLTVNLHRLFPQAKPPRSANVIQAEDKKPVQGRQALVRLIMETHQRSILCAEEIEAVTGIPSSKLTREFTAIEEDIRPLGWTVKSAIELKRPGRSRFLVNDARLAQELMSGR